MRKRRLGLVAGVIVSGIVLLASPAAAGIGYSNAAPYYSGGSGAGRECAFFGHTVYAPSHGFQLVVTATTSTTHLADCGTNHPLNEGWIIANNQLQALVGGVWSNVFSLQQSVNPGGSNTALNFVPWNSLSTAYFWRDVSGHSAFLGGNSRITLDLGPAFVLP